VNNPWILQQQTNTGGVSIKTSIRKWGAFTFVHRTDHDVRMSEEDENNGVMTTFASEM